jgi:oligopeptide/dipeptide ABC transporter ATP-binding protein
VTGNAPLLEVRELAVEFTSGTDTVRAVDHVSFQVEAGERVGLVGESGCGKSATALALLGLLPSRVGRILPGSSVRYRGEELVGMSPRALARIRGREVGMVFQDPATALNPLMRVGDQVAEGLRLHRGMSRSEAMRRAMDALAEVGIPDPSRRVRAWPHELSGGMRQRVALAMALAPEPRLLLADEPTTALDVTIQAQVLELLEELTLRREMALLLISHDLGVVAERCRRVLVMYGGQVMEEGPTHRIFTSPRHPYTRGLLGSLPGVHHADRRLRPIPGMVPSRGAWPSGCRFHTRCPHAGPRCRAETPPLFPLVDAEGASRCWLETPEGTGVEAPRAGGGAP